MAAAVFYRAWASLIDNNHQERIVHTSGTNSTECFPQTLSSDLCIGELYNLPEHTIAYVGNGTRRFYLTRNHFYGKHGRYV